MAGVYQHASDWVPGVHTPFSGVIRVADGKFIACAADSQDWQDYLTWAATDVANVPDPFLSPNAGGVAIVLGEGEVAYGAMLGSIPAVDPALSPPVMVDIPNVSGDTAIGAVLTCTMGNWSGMGEPPATYEYRWINEVPEDLSSGSTYVLMDRDAGHTVSCVVTATNLYGSTKAAPSNGIVVPVPVPEEAPPPPPPPENPVAETASEEHRSVPRHEPRHRG